VFFVFFVFLLCFSGFGALSLFREREPQNWIFEDSILLTNQVCTHPDPHLLPLLNSRREFTSQLGLQK